MVDKKVEPLFKLPADITRKLTAQENDIEKARKALATMKELGMDTKDLEEKLDWAAKVRETLIKEFA